MIGRTAVLQETGHLCILDLAFWITSYLYGMQGYRFYCTISGTFEPKSALILKIAKDFKVVDTNGKYINVSVSTPFLKDLAKSTGLPLDHYSLTSRQINKVLNHKF